MFFNWNFLSISTQFGQKWKCGPSWFIFFPISLPFYLSNSENPTFFFFFSLLFSPHFPFPNAMSNRIHKCKSFLLFYTKNLLFLYYTPIFTKHPRYPIYSAHLFNKIFILLQFFIISSLTTHLSHTQHYQKNTKILYARATIIVYICTATITLVYLCTILCGYFFFFFWLKCAYVNTFSILHYFALTDPSALTYHN